MCGICGFIGKTALTPAQTGQVRRMNSLLSHRGPDDTGFFQDGRVCLAMQRLSIVDLESGSQPVFNEDRSLVMVFNGEIYNHGELREQLTDKGHRFASRSDSETIVHLYEEYGPDCLSRLRGMFAIVLYDLKDETVFMARDRIGEKPIYLYPARDGLFFASEIKALARSGTAPKDIDPSALHHYFHYRYVPEPMTPLKQVAKLMPARFLRIRLTPWSVTETCYWRMTDLPPVAGGEPVRKLRETLAQAVEGVCRADVPMGIALSGGMDSGALACLLAGRGKAVTALSLGYTGRRRCDERRDAQALARHLNLPFVSIEARTDEMAETFPDVVYWRDDPISDIAGYGYYAIMKAARAHGMKVMIQGQGGDELFLAYDWVARGLAGSRLKNRQSGKEKPIRRSRFPDRIRFPGCANAPTPRDQLEFYNLEPMYGHCLKSVPRMYTDTFRRRVAQENVNALFTVPAPWKDVDVLVMDALFRTYLLQNGIAQGDRLSMAHSVELRLPLLDHKLVELVVGLRKAGTDMGTGKSLFRAALGDRVPGFVLNRPKRGFSPPVRSWQTTVCRRYGHLLKNGFLVDHGIIDARYMDRQVTARGMFRGTARNAFMKLLVLELWFRQMIG